MHVSEYSLLPNNFVQAFYVKIGSLCYFLYIVNKQACKFDMTLDTKARKGEEKGKKTRCSMRFGRNESLRKQLTL